MKNTKSFIDDVKDKVNVTGVEYYTGESLFYKDVYKRQDYICVHTAFDVQSSGKDPLDELKIVNRVIQHAQSAVAGGVKLSTIDAIVEEGAGIIVVGGAICNAQARAEAAKEMKRHLR